MKTGSDERFCRFDLARIKVTNERLGSGTPEAIRYVV
jgi:hypothetical protein